MAVVKDRESTLLMKLEDAEKRLRALKGEGGSGKSGVDSMEVDQGGDAMEVDSAGMVSPVRGPNISFVLSESANFI
tara:strand:+ start:289 stop:516 length:228 start_codon:yes stop_codon:yes gene_type:complete